MNNKNFNLRKFTELEKFENLNLSTKLIDKDLSLRKLKLNDRILSKRINFSNAKGDDFSLEIKIDELDIQSEHKNYNFENFDCDTSSIILQMLESNHDYNKLGLFYLRKILNNNVYDSSLKIGKELLNKLIEFLMTKKDKHILYEVYWIFINISIHNDEDFLQKFNNTTILNMMNLHFKLDIDVINEEIIWLLSHLVNSNHKELTNLIVKSNITAEIIESMYSDNYVIFTIQKALFFFQNIVLATKNDYDVNLDSILRFVEIGSAFLYSNKIELFSSAVELLSVISRLDCYSLLQEIMNLGVIVKIQRFDDIFNIQNENVVEFAKKIKILESIIDIIGNFFSYSESDEFTQVLIDLDILDYMSYLFEYQDGNLRKKIIWCCSNICASNVKVCFSFVNSPLYPEILANLKSLGDKNTHYKEILIMISNVLSHVEYEISFKFINYSTMEDIIRLGFTIDLIRRDEAFLILNIFKDLFVSEIIFLSKYSDDQNIEKEKVKYMFYFIRFGGLELIDLFKNIPFDSIGELCEKIEMILRENIIN